MLNIHDPAVAEADRPNYERLHRIFFMAVKPQIAAQIEKIPVPGIGERIWGTVAGVCLSAIAVADRISAGAPKQVITSPKMSFEEQMSWEYAHNLTAGWLRGLRLTKDDTGVVCGAAVFPDGSSLSEHWARTRESVRHFGDIDLEEVMRKGLENLAAAPGDVALPMGMTIKRPVFDAALTRANGP